MFDRLYRNEVGAISWTKIGATITIVAGLFWQMADLWHWQIDPRWVETIALLLGAVGLNTAAVGVRDALDKGGKTS